MHTPPDTLLDNLTWVRRLASRLVVDAHRAEDVAQTALYEALRNPPPFAGDRQRLRRWLGGIVRHEARNTIGRESERPWRESQAAHTEAKEVLDLVETTETRDTLLVGLEQLPAADRQRLVWHYLEGLPIAVIAARENASPGTTRKRLERARSRLRDWLDQRYGDRTTWCAALATMSQSKGVHGGLAAARIWGGLAVLFLAAAGVWVALGFWSGDPSVVLALSPPEPAAADPADSVAAITGPSLAPERTTSAPAAGVLLESSPFVVVRAAEDASPLVGATVIAMDADGKPWTATTNAAGLAVLPDGAQTHWIAAGMTERVATARAPGQNRSAEPILLERAEPLSGQVIGVEGTASTRQLPLTSYVDVLAHAPPWIASGLRRAGVPGRVPYAVALDEDGRWSVDGVPADWSGRLHAPKHTWFAGLPTGVDRLRRNAVEVRNPRPDLAFRVRTLPVLRGRVVDTADGRPLALATVLVVPFVEGDLARRSFATQTRADGSFEVSYGPGSSSLEAAWLAPQRPVVERVELTVEFDGYETLRSRLDGPMPPEGNLAELELERNPMLLAQVFGEQGEPLEAALAFVASATSRPAKADGIVRMQATRETSNVAVFAAEGHRRRGMAVSRIPHGGPERVALEPGGEVSLTLALDDPRGEIDVENLRAELYAQALPFKGACEGQGFPEPLGSPSQPGFRPHMGTRPADDLVVPWGAHVWVADLTFDANGCIRLSGFDPDVRLEFVVRDRFGRILARAGGATPRSRETLQLVATCPDPIATLRIRVVDETGAPIPQAAINVRVQSFSQRIVSDRRGKVALASCKEAVEDLRIDAGAAGFAMRRHVGLDWSPGDDDLVLTLERARPLVVQLHLPPGTAPDSLELIAESADGLRQVARPLGTGDYLFENLGTYETSLLLNLDGVQHVMAAEAGARELTFVVPAPQ